MDADLAEFVQLLDLAGKSTIAKYQAIASRAVDGLTDNNPRVHGAYMFAGAAQSGRYSSPGIQVHNMVRKVPEDASRIIAAFKHRCVGRQFGEPLHLLGQLVRPTITGDPDDRFDLVWCDWSSVEAMVLPWLTLDAGADDRLEAFRRGEDIYLKTASRIAGRTITKADAFERNCFGKVPELSLGYCGGAGAFKSMMKNYSVHLPEKQIVEIVKTWRAQNPWAMAFGDGLEQAAMNAIRYPGSSYSHGRIGYVFDEDALDGIGALYAVLPSGRKLCYPNARIDVVRTPYGRDGLQITAMKGAWHPKRGEKEWPRVGIWKGLLVENACQAIATADLLNASLLRARQKYRLTVAGHTHDEILIETPDPERDAKRLLECMLEKPDWPGIDALPLRAEVDCGFRYKVKF
jgi:DNA polymerase